MPSVNDQRVRFLDAGQFEQLLISCPSWLKSIIWLKNAGGTEENKIHTSCSQDLCIGDKFGSLEVVAFENAKQGLVQLGDQVE